MFANECNYVVVRSTVQPCAALRSPVQHRAASYTIEQRRSPSCTIVQQQRANVDEQAGWEHETLD